MSENVILTTLALLCFAIACGIAGVIVWHVRRNRSPGPFTYDEPMEWERRDGGR